MKTQNVLSWTAGRIGSIVSSLGVLTITLITLPGAAIGAQAAVNYRLNPIWNKAPSSPYEWVSVNHTHRGISWPAGGLKAANNVAGSYSEIIHATSPLAEPVSTNRFYSIRRSIDR